MIALSPLPASSIDRLTIRLPHQTNDHMMVIGAVGTGGHGMSSSRNDILFLPAYKVGFELAYGR